MRTALAALAALSLAAGMAGCATTPTSHLQEGKVLADTWAAFDAATTTLDSLAIAGSLSASEKATLRADLPEVKTALEAATAAYDANNDATAAQNVAAATTLIAQLVAIVKAH